MGDRDWRPFIYGGLASIVAEFGKETYRFNFDRHNLKLIISSGAFDCSTGRSNIQPCYNAIIS